jgi:acetyl esterase/lipase
VAAHTEAYGLDASRLVVYGTSAGAVTVEGLCYFVADPGGRPPPPRIVALGVKVI